MKGFTRMQFVCVKGKLKPVVPESWWPDIDSDEEAKEIYSCGEPEKFAVWFYPRPGSYVVYVDEEIAVRVDDELELFPVMVQLASIARMSSMESAAFSLDRIEDVLRTLGKRSDLLNEDGE